MRTYTIATLERWKAEGAIDGLTDDEVVFYGPLSKFKTWTQEYEH